MKLQVLRRLFVATFFAVLQIPHAAIAQDAADAAQHDHAGEAAAAMPMMMGPLNIGDQRDGSGTSWLPDFTPMQAVHAKVGDWNVMTHWNAFLQYIDEGGTRGADQVGSVNWLMAMASRSAAGGTFSGRVMFSAEPLTVRKCGYPDLLASGENCNGQKLHDQQHPHDVFMEVAARYQRQITSDLAWEVYGGPAGEPALGPTAFPHRASAMPNLLAPLSHHWLDATHISYGVLTGGIYGRRWKAEASVFNGREPDDNRYDFDFGALDSYSGRFWFLPDHSWALQVSAGHLKEAEKDPDGPMHDVDRVTASATYHYKVADAAVWASTLAWGANRQGGDWTNAVLAETAVTAAQHHVVFGRMELNQKTGEELVLPSALATEVGSLFKLQGGYTYELARTNDFVMGIGGSVWLSVVPDRFAPFYGGTRTPGAAVFLNIHPRSMPPMIH